MSGLGFGSGLESGLTTHRVRNSWLAPLTRFSKLARYKSCNNNNNSWVRKGWGMKCLEASPCPGLEAAVNRSHVFHNLPLGYRRGFNTGTKQ